MRLNYDIALLTSIMNGKILLQENQFPIAGVFCDSRNPSVGNHAAFFAIHGNQNDGHKYIQQLYNDGIRHFIVEREIDLHKIPDAFVLLVNNSIDALQKLASYHRQQFNIPVLAITGSNGKTTVKEWLYELLREEYSIVRSPKSYNSQLGVPLSILQLESHHELALFEAGISQPGEMLKLEKMLQPTIGVFTHLGAAHSSNFKNEQEKVTEKCLLFQSVEQCFIKENELVESTLKQQHIAFTSWQNSSGEILSLDQKEDGFQLTYKWETISYQTFLPFLDSGSVDNALMSLLIALQLGISPSKANKSISALQALSMRMEIVNCIQNCQLIHDAYNSDLGSLSIALDHLEKVNRAKRILILSDFDQDKTSTEVLYKSLASIIKAKKVDLVFCVGKNIKLLQEYLPDIEHFENTDSFLASLELSKFQDAAILLKGNRSFQFEKISAKLQEKKHLTRLTINLDALTHNLSLVRNQLDSSTKLMVMVKAFAYGSGIAEIGQWLQRNRVDYLGVAYADEGIALRKAGVTLPILVMSPEPHSFDTITDYQLEPEIYSLSILDAFIRHLIRQNCLNGYPIHLKIDTGMHRLGFSESDLTTLIDTLKAQPEVKVASIFSHLAAADEEIHDAFTKQQLATFDECSNWISKQLNYPVLRHILNSSGIERFGNKYQFNLVRLGIGLYGMGIQNTIPVGTLESVITQIRTIPTGDSIGYSRNYVAKSDLKIAIIPIGYADGYLRSLSNKGKVWIQGKLVPIVGNVCMDMCMIDVTDIECKEGDNVEIFGSNLPIEKVAEWADTIVYELLSGISSRVKRVYITS